MFLVALGVLGFQSSFLDNPKNHWAYEGLSYFKSSGLLMGYPDGLGTRRTNDRSRYEMAVVYWACSSHILSLTHRLAEDMESLALAQPGSKEAGRMVEHEREVQVWISQPILSRSLAYLERGSREFAVELNALTASPEIIPKNIAIFRQAIAQFHVVEPGSALRQFSDVAPNHWAAQAVLNLRSNGILRGYPDGKFQG